MTDQPHTTLPEIPLTEMEGEPRARDLDIAERLGFDRPRKVRDLIKSHLSEFEAFGVCPAVGQTSGAKGGRPSTEFWLNEEQALLVATLSDAPNAPAVRAMLIKTFVAWRRGHLGSPLTELSAEVRGVLGGIVKSVVHRELAVLVPAAVESALVADPRRAVGDYVSVRQMLDEAKALSKKRNGLNRKCGRSLFQRAMIAVGSGQPSPARKCPHTGVWLYQRDFAAAFMKERGALMVQTHNAAVMGQSVLPFPRAPKEPPRPSDPASP